MLKESPPAFIQASSNSKVSDFLEMIKPYEEERKVSPKEIRVILKADVAADPDKYTELLLASKLVKAVATVSPIGFIVPLASNDGELDKILYLHESEIEDGGPQPRLDISPENLIPLYEDIKAKGQRDPIKVYPSPTVPGKYRIRDGHCRRTVIFNMLRRESVKAISENCSEQQAFEDAFSLNYQRKSLTNYELGAFILRLKEKYPQTYTTQEVIGKKLGISQNHLSEIMSAYAEANNLKEKVKPGNIACAISLPERTLNKIRKVPDELKGSVADVVVQNNLSVMKTEALIKKVVQDAKAESTVEEKAKLLFEDADKAFNKEERALDKLITDSVAVVPEGLVKFLYGKANGEKVTTEKLGLLAGIIFRILYDNSVAKKKFVDVYLQAVEESKRW